MIEYRLDFSPTVGRVHPQDLQIFFIFHLMYLLSCPNCQTELSITPAQAGDTIECSKCQHQVVIPKLGELRQLPQTQQPDSKSEADSRSVGGTIVFVALSLIAVAALTGAGYNAIRWGMIKTTATTELHLEEVESGYRDVEPAMMVTEFYQMEKNSLDLIAPYTYQTTVNEKAKWGWNAVIAAAIAAGCATGAFIAAAQRRKE